MTLMSEYSNKEVSLKDPAYLGFGYFRVYSFSNAEKSFSFKIECAKATVKPISSVKV
jgi:hypothetical protein